MLEVRDVDAFYGDAQALRGVSLTVGDGEIVCLVGSNGAGKSTLVNAVIGMQPVRSGNVLMDGVDLTAAPAHRVCRAGVAVVPEGRRIFPDMTVVDNLRLGAYRPEARPGRDRTLAWVHSLFPRLAERPGQRAGSLSGGEQQMLAIGRALMAQPRLLLMDEPSLGLAPVMVDEVFDVIHVINRSGVGVLLVEQNVARALEVADRGYLISEGRIVLDGTAVEMAAADEVRRAVLGV
jgi:branched-chain amino acid transport system ATP-binding protein